MEDHLKAAAEAAQMSDADLAAALADIGGRSDLTTYEMAIVDEVARRRGEVRPAPR